jgi:hypothetical protein
MDSNSRGRNHSAQVLRPQGYVAIILRKPLKACVTLSKEQLGNGLYVYRNIYIFLFVGS